MWRLLCCAVLYVDLVTNDLILQSLRPIPTFRSNYTRVKKGKGVGPAVYKSFPWRPIY